LVEITIRAAVLLVRNSQRNPKVYRTAPKPPEPRKV
jgi:hypothetical protein